MSCFVTWILCKAFREDNDELRNTFPPLTNARVPMGDVFTSCNWVIRDGLVKWKQLWYFTYCLFSAPKTASKRVFLITDEDNPHPSTGSKQLITSARTTLVVCSVLAHFHWGLTTFSGSHTSRCYCRTLLYHYGRQTVHCIQILLRERYSTFPYYQWHPIF